MRAESLWGRWAGPGLAVTFALATNGGWMFGPPVPRVSIWMDAVRMTKTQIVRMPAINPSRRWDGVVYLRPSDVANLEARARAVSNPSSPQYHHFLSRSEVAHQFSPTLEEVRSVEQTLNREGFRVQGATGLGLGIRVSGTVGLVDRVWSAGIRRDAEGQGVETQPIVLSGVLAQSVSYISDLAPSSYTAPPVVKKPHSRSRHPVNVIVQSVNKNISVSAEGPTSVPSGQNILITVSVVNPTTRFPLKGWNISANPDPNAILSSYQVSDLNGNLTLNKSGSDVLVLSSSSPYSGNWQISVSSGNISYDATIKGLSWTGPTVISNDLSPEQVNTAYDANGLVAAARAAGGMRIGIFADSSPTLSDLSLFEKRYHLPTSKVNVVSVDGGEKKPLSGWHGELMLDMERAISSAPGATLDLYTVPPNGSITDTVAAAINQDVDQVFSISAVEPENSVTSRHLAVWNALMAEGSLEGITFIAGSGDSGPYGDPSSSVADTNWPASSDWVTAVGGTQLGLNPTTDAIESQWAWSPDGLWDNQIDGSGGGYSRIQPVPVWQKGIVGADATGRGVPDVAFLAAEPYYAAIDNGVWEGMAGTSASTPTWAGWVADMAVLDGRPGFMNPAIYSTYTHDRSAFYSVIHGGNALYQAGPGWNPLTGLGSVVVDQFWQQDDIAAASVSASTKRVRVGSTVILTVRLKNRRGVLAPVPGVPIKLTGIAPSVSVNNQAAGLSAVVDSNSSGEAVFSVVSRQLGTYHLSVSVDTGGRSPMKPKTVTMDWTRASSPLLPFVHKSAVLDSADVTAESLFPTGVSSHTAVVSQDPLLTPKLALDTVALARAVGGPVLFANRQGVLSSATIATLRRLNISRVVVVGNLQPSTLGLPRGIAIASRIWTPSTATLFLQVVEATVAHTGVHGVVLVSARAPQVEQMAAAALASHRRVGMLLLPTGALGAATLRFLAAEKSVWTIGTLSLPKTDHLRTVAIQAKSPLATVLQVDRLNHAGPEDLVAFNQDSQTSALAVVMTTELAASWRSALVPVNTKTMPALSQQYLSSLSRLSIENLFLVGLTTPIASGVEHALMGASSHHSKAKA